MVALPPLLPVKLFKQDRELVDVKKYTRMFDKDYAYLQIGNSELQHKIACWH